MLWSGEIKPRVSLALDVVMKSGLNKKNINAASNLTDTTLAVAI